MTDLMILIPVDGTEFSEAIFPKLAQFADPAKTEIMLLRVSELVTHPMQVRPGFVNADFSPAAAEGNVRHTVRDEMMPEVDMLEGMGYRVRREVGFGEPAEQILFFADLAKADLIAMTTHGREGISRLLAGSVANLSCTNRRYPC